MAQSRKAIKLRIKSIRNTRKITKAMELVAASKMRRAVAAALKARNYAETAFLTISQAISSLSEKEKNIFLEGKKDAKKTLIILFSSDRGLAGGLNVNLIRLFTSHLKENLGTEIEVIAIGKRGADAAQRLGIPVIARFPALTNHPSFNDLLPAARLAVESFTDGQYKKILVNYTHFISGISQQPKIYELLPFKRQDLFDQTKKEHDVLFEPSPARVLEKILPALAKTMLWQALLEAGASEHAARMMAMKNASDAAGDMLDQLTFTYNQVRQAGITQEIAEISSGKAALE